MLRGHADPTIHTQAGFKGGYMSTWKEIAEASLSNEYHKHFEGADEYKNMVSLYRECYEGNGDPTCLLAAFCYHIALVDSERKDKDSMVPVPLWILNPLATGFASYLNGITKGEKISLEESIGITKQIKEETGRLTTINKMAEQVHILRWLFGLNVTDACKATYRKFEHLAKSNGLSPEQQGITQKPEIFVQNYHRKYASDYLKWREETEARGAVPTEKGRNQILSQMSSTMAGFVKRKMKPIT